MKKPAPKFGAVVHVVHGNDGFHREVRCSARKLARIQQHEFSRIEKAGNGFLRIELPGKFTTWAEIHYERTPRRGWMTHTRGEPARFYAHE